VLTFAFQIASLLERLNGHNLDQQMSALQNLERQAQEENSIMRQLAEKNSHEATSVKILTIMTLIYLPCTVVSVSLYAPLSLYALTNNSGLLLYPFRRPRNFSFWRHYHEVCKERLALLCGLHSIDCVYYHDMVHMGKLYSALPVVQVEAQKSY
jgi:hypothetical protein